METSSVAAVTSEILRVRSRVPAERSVLVAVTGIDASGKGYVAAYRRTYFAAQELHFARDDPRGTATIVIDNDTRSSP